MANIAENITGSNPKPLFDLGRDDTQYRLLTREGISLQDIGGRQFLIVEPETISRLTDAAFTDASFLFRTSHLKQLALILEDDEASENDLFVARTMLKNAAISAEGIFPMCQDTGTAIVVGKKGQNVLVDGTLEAVISEGIERTYATRNLRFSQLAPLTMFEERNTGTNLPAQIEIEAVDGDEFKFLFIAKGGGSANKAFLFQQTPRILNPERLIEFLDEKIKTLGATACPPYHLSIVIGGLTAEQTMKSVKMASCRAYDNLPSTGSPEGRAFRDHALEEKIHALTVSNGIGAQFGGKYFCHDVRVIRLPRHGASVPIGIGVSCAADRQIKAKINSQGAFLEKLETDVTQFLPGVAFDNSKAVRVDLNRPVADICKDLSKLEVKTPVLLSGTVIVARDLVHAEMSKLLVQGKPLPDYIKAHPIYYAGPAKTPEGFASGSFGPTTAARMDPYVPELQEHGASLITIAKGNRSRTVVDACQKYGGFFLGAIGGVAAMFGRDVIKSVEAIAFQEFGMEAVWKIEVEDFPAFVVIDDKGGDFFA